LVFEAAGRLPKATRYTVDIPANLEAAGGEPLGEAVQWTFATSPPIVLEVVPPDVPGRSPVLALVFDQRVDAEAVLPFLRLEIEGRDFPLRLTPADDSSAAEVLGRAMWRGRVAGQSAPDSAQFVVVRPEDSLPSLGADSDEMIEAVIRTLPGLPSLEGPERTIADAEHRFEIARAFSVVEHGCGRAFTCWPGVPWTIRFNHQLGVRPDSGTWLRVDPPLPGATVEAWNDHLIVLGMPEEGRTYTVWVDPAVASQSGQKLGPISPLRFSIGRTPPSVWAPGGGIAMIPATQPASFPILAEGLDEIDVEVRTVTPQDWAEYESMLKTRVAGIVPWGTPVTEFYRGLAPGESLYRKTMPVKRVRGGPAEVELELDAALDGTGHVLVIAEPVSDGTPAGVPDGLGHIVFSWVQRSEMQLDVQEDGDALTVYVTSVVTGRPLRDVRLTLTRETATSSRTGPREPRDTVVTDEGGLARQLVHHVARGDSWLLRAERDGRTVLFPAMLVRGWPDPREWAPDVRRHFLTDRPIYQPGDTVRFAGWLRTAVGTGREPVLPEPLSYIEYVAHDPRGATLAQGQIFEMSPNGRIEGSFVLPAEANAGRAFIELMLTGLAPEKPRTFVEFQIEEVRRPNFDLSVEVEPGPLLPGEPMTATVRARYFTGGGVPGADVRWLVGSSVSHYSPPGVTGYSFGRVIRTRNVLSPAEHTSRTDAAGDHRLDARIESVQPDVAMELTVEATVVDLDRQERTAHANMLVHPANVYVGLRAAAPFVRAGEPLEIETLVVALDGRAVADRPVTVIAMRQDRHPEAGMLVIDESERARCELMSQLEPVRCELSDLPQGDYVVVASVKDDTGRRSSSELGVRIAGETIPAGVRAAAPGVTVEPDREEYEPGDTALVLVKASFPAVEALLTLSRGGVIEAHAVTLENGAALVRLPIRDAHVPNVALAVAAHAADGASTQGEASVRIAPRTRRLEVAVTPQAAEVGPGVATTIDVTVTDSLGRPIRGADVVLSGIDQAMVALSHRAFTDPLDDIYPWSGSDVFDRTLRDHMAPALTPPGRHPVADAGGTAGTVAGVVLAGSTGAPIGGAWVEAHGVGGTWTGQDGSYQLRGVPAGEHVIVARADGYVARQIPTITVEAGGSARAHFVMLTNWEVLEGGRSLTGDPLAFGGGYAGHAALALSALEAVAMPAPSEAGRYARYRFGVSTQAGSDDVLRRDLSPVAAFVSRAVTDADGHVAIPVDMPDNLTRYRIRAVTAKGAHLFGAGESTITVRRPFIVRPTPPRFLNQGDRFELPVLLENRSGEALEVDVAV
ncbi:MAG: carboxypeptidase regulatory-like domain-containing protein, partial [Longimicrobiales bacterium]